MKSEPEAYSIDDLKKDKVSYWEGVRNYQARNNMRAMKKGDLGFFYHSQKEKEIVGIVEVIAESHPDSTTDDDRWDCVDIKAIRPLDQPVTLAMCKEDPRLAEMALVKNTRLSVQPVTQDEWDIVLSLSEAPTGDKS